MVRSEADKDGAFAALLRSVKKMKIHLDWIKVMSDYLLDLFYLFHIYYSAPSLPRRSVIRTMLRGWTSVIRAMLRGSRPSCSGRIPSWQSLSSRRWALAIQLHTLREPWPASGARLRGSRRRMRGYTRGGPATEPRSRRRNDTRGAATPAQAAAEVEQTTLHGERWFQF